MFRCTSRPPTCNSTTSQQHLYDSILNIHVDNRLRMSRLESGGSQQEKPSDEVDLLTLDFFLETEAHGSTRARCVRKLARRRSLYTVRVVSKKKMSSIGSVPNDKIAYIRSSEALPILLLPLKRSTSKVALAVTLCRGTGSSRSRYRRSKLAGKLQGTRSPSLSIPVIHNVVLSEESRQQCLQSNFYNPF